MPPSPASNPLYPRSLFPNAVDVINDMATPAVSDAIMAVEAKLLGLGPAGGTTTMNGPLLFKPDNTYDIGGAGGNPRNISTPNGVVTAGQLVCGDFEYTPTLTIVEKGVAFRWQFAAGGHFIATTDNVVDIGASGANRPRNIYAGSAVVTNNVIALGELLLGAAATNGVFGGAGAPAAGLGANGDYYLRTDTPATSLQRIYVKSAGAWVGIV